MADGEPVWCSSEALSEAEFRRRTYENLTRFDHSLSTPEMFEDALATIAEHHPGECVFVEALV